MSPLWRFLNLIGVGLFVAIAVFAIWFDSVPDILGKSFVSLVVVGLGLMLIQSVLSPRRSGPSDQ